MRKGSVVILEQRRTYEVYIETTETDREHLFESAIDLLEATDGDHRNIRHAWTSNNLEDIWEVDDE